MSTILDRVVAIATMPLVKWSAISIVSLAAAGLVVVYAGSAWRLARTYDVPNIVLRDIGRTPSAERGERWSHILGCQGCHQQAGNVLFDVPMVARLIMPNLTRVAARYSDAELVVLLRTGIKRDRTSAFIMPSDAYAWLADEDVADLIAWLRALKPLPDTTTGETSWRLFGRVVILTGGLPFSADMVKPVTVATLQPNEPQLVRGEYLEHVLCSHCHRLNEEHPAGPGLIAPALGPVAQGYEPDQFHRLLRTGTAAGERKLEMMSEVAMENFSHLDDGEIAALHAYLRSYVPPDDGNAK